MRIDPFRKALPKCEFIYLFLNPTGPKLLIGGLHYTEHDLKAMKQYYMLIPVFV